MAKSSLDDAPEFLTNTEIADAVFGELGQDFEQREEHERAMLDAVQGGKIAARVGLRKPGVPGGFVTLADSEQIAEIRDYWLGDSFVRLTISRRDYIDWARANERPIPAVWEVRAKMKPTDAIRANLTALIDEIGRRAAAKGLSFDRDVMPGRKVDFQWLAEKQGIVRAFISEATFSDYLSGICKFKSGARETDFYRDLFPEYGVSPAPSQLPHIPTNSRRA